MFKKLLTLSLISASLMSGAAYAKDHSNNGRWQNDYRDHDERRGNNGRDHDKRYNDYAIRDNDRIIIRNYYGNNYYRNIPQRHYRTFTRGQYIPRNVQWAYLPDDLTYRLPRYNNARYVAFDRNVYLVDNNSRLILDIISLAANLR